MSIADILGILGFALSLGIILYGLYSQNRQLCIYVGGVDIEPDTETSAIVIFHLCFVNPSSLHRVVCGIVLDRPTDIDIVEFEKRYSENPDFVCCQSQNEHAKETQLRKDEILEFPLDIPLNQSEKKKYPYYISWKKQQELLLSLADIRLYFRPFDVHKRFLGQKCPVDISLRDLKMGRLDYIPPS